MIFYCGSGCPKFPSCEKAFDDFERDVLRFLWFDDALLHERTMFVLLFACMVFGVSSPFLLSAMVKRHLEG